LFATDVLFRVGAGGPHSFISAPRDAVVKGGQLELDAPERPPVLRVTETAE
jgi:hypothetical protein